MKLKYDFDTPINRRGTHSLKWDVGENELPMWVADMDFQTALPIRRAIEVRAAHGVFGYTGLPDAWYEAYRGWWRVRHHFEMEKNGSCSARASCRLFPASFVNLLRLRKRY